MRQLALDVAADARRARLPGGPRARRRRVRARAARRRAGRAGAPRSAAARSSARSRAARLARLPDRAALRAGPALRRRAGRAGSAFARRRRARPFLDIRPLVLAGGEQGLLSVAFHPTTRRTGRFYVDYTDRERQHDRRRVPRQRRRRAIPAHARADVPADQPTPTTTAASSSFGPDGLLWSGMGDGGAGGDPENGAQNLSTLPRQADADRRRRPQGALAGSWAVGLRNPWRFSFDRATAPSGSATSARTRGRRSTSCRAASPAPRNYGWNATRACAGYERQAADRLGRLVRPVARLRPRRRLLDHGRLRLPRPGSPSALGRYFFGDYCTGTVWSLARRRQGDRRPARALRRRELRSFGEDAAGELYLVSLGGRLPAGRLSQPARRRRTVGPLWPSAA